MILDLMLDIETLGKGPGFIVLSAALVPFCLNGKIVDLPGKWSGGISLADSMAIGSLKIDAGTIDWWSKNDPKVIRKEFSHVDDINIFIDKIVAYMDGIKAAYPEYRVWASAPKLDFGCLYYLFTVVDREKEYPFLYSAERCYRTLRDTANLLYPGIDKQIKVKSQPNHDPTQDCNVQIVRIQGYYKALRGGMPEVEEDPLTQLIEESAVDTPPSMAIRTWVVETQELEE